MPFSSDAQKNKLLIDALVYKKLHPKVIEYRDLANRRVYRYKEFILPQAKRRLPFAFTRLLKAGVDEHGMPTGEFDIQGLQTFLDEIYRNRDEDILTSLAREESSPKESTKVNDQFEKAADDEQKIKPSEGKTETKPETKKEQVEEDGAGSSSEKVTEETGENKPETIPPTPEVVTKTGQIVPKTAVKHEEALAKPNLVISDEGKVIRPAKKGDAVARGASFQSTAKPATEAVLVPTPTFLKRSKFLRNLPVPKPVKDAGSFIQRKTALVISRAPLPVITATVLGGAGGWFMGGPMGALLGAGGFGAVTNYIIKKTENQPVDNGGEYNQQSYSSPQSGRGAGQGLTNFIGNRLRPSGGSIARNLAGKAAKQLAAKGAEGIVASQPEIWPIIGIIALALLLIMVVFLVVFKPSGGGLLQSTAECPAYPPYNGNCSRGGGSGTGNSQVVTISKTGPAAVPNGTDIVYTIQVTNNSSQTVDVDITDKIPDDTDFVSATGGPSNTNGIYDWHVSGLAANSSQSFQFTVKPNLPDIYVLNTAYLGSVVTSSPTSPSPISSLSPSPSGSSNPSNNCGGKYQLNNPLGNFGDPNCDFTEKDLYTALQQAGQVNAGYWFNVVIPCESQYNPNSYSPNSTDGDGAFGLTQMGRGQNGQYDHGNVPWQQQVTNSIAYEQVNGWTYWACAVDRW